MATYLKIAHTAIYSFWNKTFRKILILEFPSTSKAVTGGAKARTH
jgi:hypothetical protein